MKVRSHQEMLIEYDGIGLDSDDMNQRDQLLSKYKYSVIVEGEALEFDTLNKWIQMNLKENSTEELFYGKTDYNYGFKEIFFNNEAYTVKLITSIPNIYTIYPDANPTVSICKTNGPSTFVDYESADRDAILYRNLEDFGSEVNNKSLIVDSRIIEYYDGIIKGLVKHSEFDYWHYCNMIAWRTKENCRVFCLFPLSDKLRNDLEILINKQPESEVAYQQSEKKIEEKIDRVYKEASDAVMIVCTGYIGDSWISKKIIDKTQLAEVYKIPIDDVAFQSKKKTEYWFSKFE